MARMTPAQVLQKVEAEHPDAPRLNERTLRETTAWVESVLSTKVSKSTVFKAARLQDAVDEHDDFELLDSFMHHVQQQLPGTVCKTDWVSADDGGLDDGEKHYLRCCIVPRQCVEFAQAAGVDVVQLDCGHISQGPLKGHVMVALVTRNAKGRVLPLESLLWLC